MAQFIAQWADGITVRWRSLTWGEYKRLTSSTSSFLDVYSLVSTDGPPAESVPAGIAAYVTEHVSNSPFSGRIDGIKAALETSRKKATTYLSYARALVCSVLHYKLEDIDEWDPDMFFDRLALAESIERRAGRPILEPVPNDRKDKVPGSLWEQEMKQRPKKPLTQSQSETMRRVKQSRREQ